jgi:hypothetical protein
MITIDVRNAEEVAIKEKGAFVVSLGELFGMNIKSKVEKQIFNEINNTLYEKGISAHVRIV